MKNMNSIMIYEKPQNYFFGELDNVYAPLKSMVKSPVYYVYRILNTLLPSLSSFYFGEWKKYIKNTDLVVIFDYGYQKGMEKYIKKVNPKCKVCLFCWNKVDRAHSVHSLFSDKSEIYSSDKNDCSTLSFKYKDIFAVRDYYKKFDANVSSSSKKAIFVGTSKGRLPELSALGSMLQSFGIIPDIRVYGTDTESCPNTVSLHSPIAYDEYIREASASDILIDVVQSGQTGFTLRVLEAVYLSKKLISNNPALLDTDIYKTGNLLFLEDMTDSSENREKIKDFLSKPLNDYPEFLREKYDHSHWINTF